MDDKWDGGGWMMLLKSKKDSKAFSYNASYWTDSSTTLNVTDLSRSEGDSKYDSYNHVLIYDVMAIWPDVGYEGGSIPNTGTWTWMVKNFYNDANNKVTGLTGFTTKARYSPVAPNPLPSDLGGSGSGFSGFDKRIWSYDTGNKSHIFGGKGAFDNYGWLNVRWGFIFNNESDWYTPDVCGGIGLYGTWADNNATPSMSAGDFYVGYGVSGLNRSMRVELYGR